MEKSNKKAIILTSLAISAVFIAVFSLSGFAARTGTFTDDFGSTFSIDKDQTSAKIEGGEVSLPDGFGSARVMSTRVRRTSLEIIKAKIDVVDENPSGSRIIYYLSNNNGINWLQVTPGFFHNFNIKDGRLKWMAVLVRGNNDKSPSIDKITITYREDSESLRNSNDSRRVSDLANVARGLERFYEDFNQYPHVEAGTSLGRWNSLKTVLNKRSLQTDRFYVSSWPNDPSHDDPENKRDYDYQDFDGSQNFVLKALFENPKGFALASDIDGTLRNIGCNDPAYCIGSTGIRPVTPTVTSTPTSTSSTTTRQITTSRSIFDSSGIQGMVTNILAGIYGPIAKPSIVGGTTQVQEEITVTETLQPTPTPTPTFGERAFFPIQRGFLIKLRGDNEVYEVIKGQKHWIPNASVFNDYGFKTKDIRIVEKDEFNIYSRTALLRILGDSRIFYLTDQGKIKEIPNAEIFFSYGNRLEDVIDISIIEFNSYPKMKYIFLESREDTRIWLIDGDIKHPIDPGAIQRLKIPWQEIGPVNAIEFDFYIVGDEIK